MCDWCISQIPCYCDCEDNGNGKCDRCGHWFRNDVDDEDGF